jgi:hypothetical protein
MMIYGIAVVYRMKGRRHGMACSIEGEERSRKRERKGGGGDG